MAAMTETELEVFRLKMRVLFLEQVLFGMALHSTLLASPERIAKNHQGLVEALKNSIPRAQKFALRKKKLAPEEKQMLADEAREVLASLKGSLDLVRSTLGR